MKSNDDKSNKYDYELMSKNEYKLILKNILEIKDNITSLYIAAPYEAAIFKFEDEHISNIIDILNNTPNIDELHLENNLITDKGAILLKSLKYIKSLLLCNNDIKIQGAINLLQDNFVKLSLAENFIINCESNVNIKLLTDAFISNTTLINLNLYNCALTADVVSSIIGRNTSITDLNLQHNNLTDEALKNIKYNITLEILNIKDNGFTDVSAKYLSENAYLKEVDISNNKLTDIGINNLSKHCSLNKLDISNNNFTFDGLTCFFDSLILDVKAYNDHLSYDQNRTFEYEFNIYKEGMLDSMSIIGDDNAGEVE